MNRRVLMLAGLTSIFASRATAQGAAAAPKKAPPVPAWRPSFQQPIERVVERFRYYTDQKIDFAVFANGTCAPLGRGQSDTEARLAAELALDAAFHSHPDFTPNDMDDGNLLVSSGRRVHNVVLSDVVAAHWGEINARYREGLTDSEVILTPLGQNVFDDTGKKALLGRCYMFMDAQAPKVMRIERATALP